MGSQELDSDSSKKKKPPCSSHTLFLSTKIQENLSTRDPKGKKPMMTDMNHSVGSSKSMVIQGSSGSSIATEAQETETDSVKGKKVMNPPAQEDKESERNNVENQNKNEIPNSVFELNRKRKESPTQMDFSTIGVSRKLTLGDESLIKRTRRVNRDLSEQEQRIKGFRFYSREDVEEERRLGVCTQLKLYENPWKITKKLKLSDINGSARLLLGKDVVWNHIIQFWDAVTVSKVESENGVRVKVWDCDTKTEHELVFKRWFKSSHSFVFNNEWSSQFVRRRGLKVDDEIGLFWDTTTSRFFFRVLVRAPRNQPPRP